MEKLSKIIQAFFEFLFTASSTFLEEMENNHFFGKYFIFAVIASLISAFIFYKVIDLSRINENKHWWGFALPMDIVYTLISIILLRQNLFVLGFEFSWTDFILFGIFTVFIYFIFFLIWSMLFKGSGRNTSNTPTFLPSLIKK